jgi:hypothetical protein
MWQVVAIVEAIAIHPSLPITIISLTLLLTQQ